MRFDSIRYGTHYVRFNTVRYALRTIRYGAARRYETQNHLWLILEYCVGGDLLALLKQDLRLPESSVCGFALDLAAALQARPLPRPCCLVRVGSVGGRSLSGKASLGPPCLRRVPLLAPCRGVRGKPPHPHPPMGRGR